MHCVCQRAPDTGIHIPLHPLLDVRGMPADEVIYKGDMQADEIHMARTSLNPMQSAVVLSVNTTIPSILEGPKETIWEGKHDFNAARTYAEWQPDGHVGGTRKNLQDGFTRAFERIKGAIHLQIGSPTAKSVLLELHAEFLAFFRTIFMNEVGNYYSEILGKTGGSPPHDKEVMASCWALVTKLLKVMFKEIHKARMFGATLGTVKDDPVRVNGLYLYAALEELRVLQDFEAHNYRRHPKYNQMVVLHLFDNCLPRAVYEKGLVGPGRDSLRFARLEQSIAENKVGVDRVETAVGSIRAHLQLPLAGGGVGVRAQAPQVLPLLLMRAESLFSLDRGGQPSSRATQFKTRSLVHPLITSSPSSSTTHSSLWSGLRKGLVDAHCDLPLVNGFLEFFPPHGVCEVRGASPNLWFAVAEGLGFKIA